MSPIRTSRAAIPLPRAAALAALFAGVLLLSAPGGVAAQAAGPSPDAERRAAEAIDPNVLRAHVRFLADDLLGGRAPGSRGDSLARLYVATELERMGWQPGAPDGSWTQPFEIVGITTRAPETATVTGPGGKLELEPGEEFVVSAGAQTSEAAVRDAEIVFAGYGITAPEEDWDDFKDADVEDKVLLLLNNDPAGDPELFAGDTRLYYGRWTYKYEEAARRGAAGAIIVHTVPSAGYPWQVVQTSWSGEQFELPRADDEPRVDLQMWATEQASRRIAELGGHDLVELIAAAQRRDFRPVPLGVTITVEAEAELRGVETANVIGLLSGSDPQLSREAVVYSAHLDHLGTGEPDADGDSVYNGALDNALGVASMLAVAEAFTRLPEPPRRSVIVAAVAAEESGLLGSERFAAEPPRETGWLAANINLDGGNIWGPTRDITVIGLGKSTLDEDVRAVAAELDRTVKGDQFPDRGFFYRSDQFNFARAGVPAVFLETGTDVVGKPEGWGRKAIEAWEAEQYHQPSDELEDDWDLTGQAGDARLAFLVGLRVAQADRLPAWNPGDEFEAARLEALEERGDGGAAGGR